MSSFIKRPIYYQRLLDPLDLRDDDGEADEVVVEGGNDLLQLTLDVHRLNRNARTSEMGQTVSNEIV